MFTDNIYVENQKESTKKLPEQIHSSNKVAEHIIYQSQPLYYIPVMDEGVWNNKCNTIFISERNLGTS